MQVGGVLGGAGNVRRGGVEPQPASWQHQESRCWGGSTRTRATRSVRGARERVRAKWRRPAPSPGRKPRGDKGPALNCAMKKAVW